MFEGVPTFEVSRADIAAGIRLAGLLTDKAAVFPSKLKCANSCNRADSPLTREKVTDPMATASESMLLNDRYIIVRKAKELLPAYIAK